MKRKLKLVIPNKYKAVVLTEILALNGEIRDEDHWARTAELPQEFFCEVEKRNDNSIACSELIKYSMNKLNYDGLFNNEVGCQCIRNGLFPCKTFDKYYCRAGYFQKETNGLGRKIGGENFGIKYI